MNAEGGYHVPGLSEIEVNCVEDVNEVNKWPFVNFELKCIERQIPTIVGGDVFETRLQ